MIALVLIFIQAALFQNIEWRRAFNILSIALCIWMGYCILEIINPTSSLEGWILSRGLIFNGLIIVIITSLLCTRYSILKAIIFCLSIFTLFAVIKTLMQKFIGFDSFETKWLNAGGATTHIIWSGIRYFSFFTDASNMGANMGAAIMFFRYSLSLHAICIMQDILFMYSDSSTLCFVPFRDKRSYNRTISRASTLHTDQQTN